MAVVNWTKEIGTDPTKVSGRCLLGGDKEQNLIMKPTGAVYIGGEDVTTETGIELTNGANNSWKGVGPLYAVSAGSVSMAGMNWDVIESED